MNQVKLLFISLSVKKTPTQSFFDKNKQLLFLNGITNRHARELSGLHSSMIFLCFRPKMYQFKGFGGKTNIDGRHSTEVTIALPTQPSRV